MSSIPTGVPKADCFVKDSHKELESVFKGVQSFFKETAPQVVEDWQTWIKKCPVGDFVEDFLVQNPLYIPFRETLFGNDLVSRQGIEQPAAPIADKTYLTMPCVRMGQKRVPAEVPILEYDPATGVVNEIVIASKKGKLHLIYVNILIT